MCEQMTYVLIELFVVKHGDTWNHLTLNKNYSGRIPGTI